jgi:hypothetical protein
MRKSGPAAEQPEGWALRDHFARMQIRSLHDHDIAFGTQSDFCRKFPKEMAWKSA